MTGREASEEYPGGPLDNPGFPGNNLALVRFTCKTIIETEIPGKYAIIRSDAGEEITVEMVGSRADRRVMVGWRWSEVEQADPLIRLDGYLNGRHPCAPLCCQNEYHDAEIACCSFHDLRLSSRLAPTDVAVQGCVVRTKTMIAIQSNAFGSDASWSACGYRLVVLHLTSRDALKRFANAAVAREALYSVLSKSVFVLEG